ncbi:ribonuclease H-like domain-containing protein, partial [Tanacetum coccineum]
MMSEERNTHKILTNDDLLTKILIRLPILCIHLFTCVSKHWLTILTSPVFTLKRSQIHNLDPPAGLFVNHIRSSFHYDIVSLDPRIKSRKYNIDNSFTLGSTKAVDNVSILQSCNGLLPYYPIWEVIQRGNGPVSVLTDTNGLIKVLPPKTAEETLARERERKARTTLLMALPEDHLAKFHKMTDAKEMWEAIKSRFGRNDESKKMQKYILKQQFEGFSISNSEGLHKGYDRFQSLMSQLEIHGACVSTKDANQKFLRSLPSAWSQVSLIMRTKPRVDSLSFDDICPQLDHEDLEQLDEFGLEEMDLKWQVAMISMRMKKFYKKTGRKLQFDAKELVGFDKTKVECYSCHKTGHFVRECKSKGNQDGRRRDAWNTGNKEKDNGRRSGKQEDSKALVTLDGKGVDWTSHSEDKQEKYAFMACNSSGSDTEMSARDKAGLGLEYGFTTKACFVCGSLSHLIRDCVFHEKRMAKQVELYKQKGKGNVQRKDEPVWNNVQRVNHQNQFVPKAILTRTGKIPVNTARTSSANTVNTARHNFNRHAIPINAARKVNIVKPMVNNTRPKDGFHKSVSPFRKSFNRTIALRTNFSKQKVNTAEVNAVSAVKGKRETAVKPLAGCNWRPQRHYWHKVSKYNSGSSLRNCFTFKDPLGRLKPKQAWAPKRIKSLIFNVQDYP